MLENMHHGTMRVMITEAPNETIKIEMRSRSAGKKDMVRSRRKPPQ